jgi:hypothetical protein
MFNLTMEQHTQAKAAAKQIETFIRKEIMPYIEYTQEIPFGTEKTKSGRSQLNLYVGKNTLHINSQALGIYFLEKDIPTEIGAGVWLYGSGTHSTTACFELIRYWPKIKNKLLSILDQQINTRKEIATILDGFQL